jgi:hypothetical protein
MSFKITPPDKPIAAEWFSYRTCVIPSNAPDIQVRECRMAFYAGAQAFFGIMMKYLDPDAEPTDADMVLLDRCKDELEAFAAAVGEGRR